MPKRVQKPRTRVTRRMNTEIHEDSRTQRRRTRSQDLLAELDEMLADIDEVLAGINAQEFVDNYVQEGGE